MGWLDAFRGGAARKALHALRTAQQARATHGVAGRAGPAPDTARPRPLPPGRLASYERIERTITLEVSRFPWGGMEAHHALVQHGFDPRHVKAYLESPAMRALLDAA